MCKGSRWVFEGVSCAGARAPLEDGRDPVFYYETLGWRFSYFSHFFFVGWTALCVSRDRPSPPLDEAFTRIRQKWSPDSPIGRIILKLTFFNISLLTFGRRKKLTGFFFLWVHGQKRAQPPVRKSVHNLSLSPCRLIYNTRNPVYVI